MLPEIETFTTEGSLGGGVVHFLRVEHLVCEISVGMSFPIVTACRGQTIGFRCEPAVVAKNVQINIFF